MSSSLDHKCQRCGSQYHGQVCPFCTITGLDVNALLASEGLTMPQPGGSPNHEENSQGVLLDVVSNRTYPILAPVCRFGRDISNDIVLTGDKSLSRFHFQLTVTDGQFFVEDAGSRNGTFLNGTPVTAPRKVGGGDIISAGMSRYRLALANGDDLPINVDGNAEDDFIGAKFGTVEAPKSAAPAAPAQMQPEAPKIPPALATPATAETLTHSVPVFRAAEPPTPTPSPPPIPFIAPPQTKPAPESAVDPTLKQTQPDIDAAITPAKPESVASAPAPAPSPAVQVKRMPLGNKPETDVAASSLESLIPFNKEDELSDTASRFLKLAQQHSLEKLWTKLPDDNAEASEKPAQEAQGKREWPAWCTAFTFGELDEIRNRVRAIEAEIATRQIELEQLSDTLYNAELLKNRLLATHDHEMVDACAAVFRGLGWDIQLNDGTTNELVIRHDGKALALAKIVCTETQPTPGELANLVSSLSIYWSTHGVEPKGILLVSFQTDGPLQNRPELTQDLAEYALKKNVCLMTSLQLLAIYREAALREGDTESIKNSILNASGQLQGFEISPVEIH
jgi:FHA domain